MKNSLVHVFFPNCTRNHSIAYTYTSTRTSHESISFINQSKKQKQLFLLKTDIVIAKLKNREQVSGIDAFSMMESFYVWGGGDYAHP